MKESRSTSQVLYGFLPQQTVDLKGDVWKVREWRNALRVSNVDDETLRRELLRLVHPWEVQQNDNYLGRSLRRNDPISVLEVNPENGVEVEPFPRQWVCRACKRLHNSADARCPCGATSLSSFHFVGYHDQCGALREVPLPRPCPEHRQLAVRFPGASSSSELRFVCPVCDRILRKGFPAIPCTCGKPGNLAFNVHRAAAVFTPRTVVVVNAPRAEQRQAIAQAGGRSRALSWMLDGMQGRVTDTAATEESLRQGLEAQRLPKTVIDAMVAQAMAAGLGAAASVELRPDVKEDAEDQAVTVALASLNSRQSLADLQDLASGTAMAAKRALYRDHYPFAISEAGLESVDLMDRFPILTGVFGYTRGEYSPGASGLVPFRSQSGGINLHADFAETEALFFRLEPMQVATWLVRRGWTLPAFENARAARLAILSVCNMPAGFDRDRSIHQDLFMLVHSYAHRSMRIGAKFAGIDRSALAELLVPLHLGFFVYAVARGDFVLGGLQAVYESRLHDLLGAIVHDERRCPMDPGCSKGGGACPACLHVGEPSCRWFNQLLDRETLFGSAGYLRTHAVSQAPKPGAVIS